MRVRLPSPTAIEDQKTREYLNTLVQALERALAKIPEGPFMRDRIKVTNDNPKFDLDVSAATLGEVRQVLGTLLTFMQDKGVLP